MSTPTIRWVQKSVSQGRFVVTRRLPDGRALQTYLGEDAEGRSVLIKVPILAHVPMDPVWRERFERQVLALQRLNTHPNLMPLLDAGEEEESPYLVLRYMDGGSLRNLMCPDGQPEAQQSEELFSWLPAVAEALDFLHENAFAPCNVKPENVLFDTARNPYLTDFGVLADLAQDQAHGPSGPIGSTLGTAAYLAPEQLRGETAGGRSDQFALAVMVYEWLAGRRPFLGETPEEILGAQDQPPTPLHELRPDLPPEAAQTVEQALSRDPDARFPSCQEFANRLWEALFAGDPMSVDDAVPTAWPAQTSEVDPALEDSEPGTLAFAAVHSDPSAPAAAGSSSAPALLRRGPTFPPAGPSGPRRSFVSKRLRWVCLLLIVAVSAVVGSLLLVAHLKDLEKERHDLADQLDQRRKEKELLTARLADSAAELKDLDAELDGVRKTKADVSKDLAATQAQLAEARDQRKAVEKQRDEAAGRADQAEKAAAMADTEAAAAKDALDQIKHRADKVDDALKATRQTMEGTKLWFVVRNPKADTTFPCSTRSLSWDGVWGDWHDQDVKGPGPGSTGTTRMISPPGAVRVELKYNAAVGGGAADMQTIQVVCEVLPADFKPLTEYLDPVYVVKWSADGKSVSLDGQGRK